MAILYIYILYCNTVGDSLIVSVNDFFMIVSDVNLRHYSNASEKTMNAFWTSFEQHI